MSGQRQAINDNYCRSVANIDDKKTPTGVFFV